jgi:nucleoside-diphosphate-sugar epimerase
VIARLSSVYGPGSMRALRTYRDALGGTLFTIGPSTQLDDLVFVDDIVDGLRRCGELHDARAPIYNLAGGAPRPLRDVYGAIAAAGGTRLRQRPLPVLPFRALAAAHRATRLGASLDTPLVHRITHVPRSRAYSIERARRDLGYRPAVGLEEGAARTLAWYRETGLLSPPTQERAA